MTDCYLGEIRMFGGRFAPVDWAFCEGQQLSIAGNEALFVLLGTTYGGDGQSTFALPDLRGRIPLHFGDGAAMGVPGGAESVTLTPSQLPAHSHTLQAANADGDQASPNGNLLARSSTIKSYINDAPVGAFHAQSITATGESQPHDNMQPFLCVNFIISLSGIYPSQG